MIRKINKAITKKEVKVVEGKLGISKGWNKEQYKKKAKGRKDGTEKKTEKGEKNTGRYVKEERTANKMDVYQQREEKEDRNYQASKYKGTQRDY